MPAPPKLEDGGQAMVDNLVEVNLGTEDNFCLTFISARLFSQEQTQYLEFFRQNRDVFARNYSKMFGLDPNVAVHRLGIDLT